MPVKNIKQRKLQIRNVCKKYRINLPVEKKQQFDLILQEKFLQTEEYKNADVLLAFVSKDIEIDTNMIINQALADGKTLALPKCKEENLMDFYIVDDLANLKEGYYGLSEPDSTKCQLLQSIDNSVCLVPGLAFDMEGYRIGFGKGYYDRFLLDFKGVTVGMCYTKCVEEKLPRGYYDRPIDILITEKYKIDTRPN